MKKFWDTCLHILSTLSSEISKLFLRFSNYKNSKKWFVVYLAILVFFFAAFSIVDANGEGKRLIFSRKSSIIVDLALLGLFCWNLSISFKNRLIKLCSLREDEPLVDFILLWIIASVFLGIIDWASIAIVNWITQKINIDTTAVLLDWLLLIIWLCWSLYPFRKNSHKRSKRTKILNIVEENHKSEKTENKEITHLFDDIRH